MRICKHCECEMIEGFDVKVEGAGYGIKISNGTGIFSKRLERPKVAICPKCGEISLYIGNIEKIEKIVNNEKKVEGFYNENYFQKNK